MQRIVSGDTTDLIHADGPIPRRARNAPCLCGNNALGIAAMWNRATLNYIELPIDSPYTSQRLRSPRHRHCQLYLLLATPAAGVPPRSRWARHSSCLLLFYLADKRRRQYSSSCCRNFADPPTVERLVRHRQTCLTWRSGLTRYRHTCGCYVVPVAEGGRYSVWNNLE